jgi:hypothetical protein
VWRRVCHDPLCYANGRPIYQPFHFA